MMSQRVAAATKLRRELSIKQTGSHGDTGSTEHLRLTNLKLAVGEGGVAMLNDGC
jgi:hypothetical protein